MLFALRNKTIGWKTEVDYYPLENTWWAQRWHDLKLQWAPISKENKKQKHEEASEMALGKMNTKDSSPEEQTESVRQGHP